MGLSVARVSGPKRVSHGNTKTLQRDGRQALAIEVIDLKAAPALAADHQILAVPTLIRMLPESIRTVIGTLADTERVLVGLDIAPPPRIH